MGIDIAAERKEKELATERAKKQAETKAKLQAGAKAFADEISGGEQICTQCGRQGRAKTITKGSIFIELVLWICFLIPGLIYSIWRLSSRTKACPDCKTPTMISVNSPRGKLLVDELNKLSPN